MNSSGTVRLETLNKENYDTWKIQIEALLVKNDAWDYVNGTNVKPELVVGNVASEAVVKAWIDADKKAKSDLILSISPSELKQVKYCVTSREVWTKLEGIFQSKGPARKATLLKQLTLQRMQEGEDVREHTGKFFNAVDKLRDMDVEINSDLLSVMLLYSLPASFENFRCAIESRDDLPSPETLRVKIAEESDARKDIDGRNQNALAAERFSGRKHFKKRNSTPQCESENKPFRYKCHKCRQVGHMAKDCRNRRPTANKTEDASLFAIPEINVFEAFSGKDYVSHKKWCIDSGCSSHLCRDLSDFCEIETGENGKLNLANNASTEIKAKGVATLVASVNSVNRKVRLHDALHVPDLRTNLISVGKITEKGFTVTFKGQTAEVLDQKGNMIIIADRIDGLYYIRCGKEDNCRNVIEDSPKKLLTRKTLREWHNILGHLNVNDIREAARNRTIKGLNIVEPNQDFQCEICLQGKMTRPPFPKKSEKETYIGEIIHSDVCGPMRVLSNGKARYFATFIDDASRYCEVRFLKQKSDVRKEFESFRALFETQHGERIKFFQSDNGKEYVNGTFDELLRTHGIQRRLTAAYNPEQNGVAERKNRSLTETARCLLLQSGLPPSFWAEAVHAANYIRNRSPTSKLNGKTPYEAWFGVPPDVTQLREFGHEVYCLDRSHNKGKFEPRSRRGIFLGPSDESKAYRIWVPEERKVEISRDVKFMKNMTRDRRSEFDEFYLEQIIPEDIPRLRKLSDNSSCIDVDLTRNQHPAYAQDNSDDGEKEVWNTNEEERRETPRRPPKRGRGRPRKLLTGRPGRPKRLFSTREVADFAFLTEVPIKEAMSSPESLEWKKAMASEMTSILKNDTWVIVDRPEKREVIGSRMVLRNKFGPEGKLEKRKARIVARGFSQRPGMDFHETYAPVARLKSIRIATALAVRQDMHIHQYDITTAYLNGTLEEEVYMEAPDFMEEILEHIIDDRGSSREIVEGAKKMLIKFRSGDKVCLMKKALYGLRQAGRVWYRRLDSVIRSFGAAPSEADPCVYLKDEGNWLSLIIIYVDDIIVFSQSLDSIVEFGRHLKNHFEVKELGEMKHCLGMDFKRSNKSIRISQEMYIKDILRRFGMLDCNPVSTPMDVSMKLSKSEPWTKSMGNRPPYRELVGALMYLSVTTRPDISHAASVLSQFSSSFGHEHWLAAKRVLRYLKGSMNLGIVYHSQPDELIGYVDADWGGSLDDRRSYTGYAFTWCGGIVSWESKKQRTVALSSTESEYMALGEAAKEAVYLRRFLCEIGIANSSSVKLCNDNMGAQKLAENPTFHGRTKHIDVRHHFVRELLDAGQIVLDHVSTEEMPADVFTKALPRPKHWTCLRLIGISERS